MPSTLRPVGHRGGVSYPLLSGAEEQEGCTRIGPEPFNGALRNKRVDPTSQIPYDKVLGIFSGHAHVSYERVVNGIPLFGLRTTAPQPVLQKRARKPLIISCGDEW